MHVDWNAFQPCLSLKNAAPGGEFYILCQVTQYHSNHPHRQGNGQTILLTYDSYTEKYDAKRWLYVFVI